MTAPRSFNLADLAARRAEMEAEEAAKRAAFYADDEAARALETRMTPAKREAYSRAKYSDKARRYGLPRAIIAARVLAGRPPTSPLPPFDADAIAARVARGRRTDDAGVRLDETTDGRLVIAARLRVAYPDITRAQAAEVLPLVTKAWNHAEFVAEERATQKQRIHAERLAMADAKYAESWGILHEELLRNHVIKPHRPDEDCWICFIRPEALVEVRGQRAAGLEAHLSSQWAMATLQTRYRGPGMDGTYRISATVAPALNMWLMASEEELRGVIRMASPALNEMFAPGAPQPIPVAWYNPPDPLRPKNVATPDLIVYKPRPIPPGAFD